MERKKRKKGSAVCLTRPGRLGCAWLCPLFCPSRALGGMFFTGKMWWGQFNEVSGYPVSPVDTGWGRMPELRFILPSCRSLTEGPSEEPTSIGSSLVYNKERQQEVLQPLDPLSYPPGRATSILAWWGFRFGTSIKYPKRSWMNLSLFCCPKGNTRKWSTKNSHGRCKAEEKEGRKKKQDAPLTCSISRSVLYQDKQNSHMWWFWSEL